MANSKAYLSFVLLFAFLLSSCVLTHELPEGESSLYFFHPNDIVSIFFSCRHIYRDSGGAWMWVWSMSSTCLFGEMSSCLSYIVNGSHEVSVMFLSHIIDGNYTIR